MSGGDDDGEREEDEEDEEEKVADSNYISEDEGFDLGSEKKNMVDEVEEENEGDERFGGNFEIYNLFPFTVGKTKHF